ncbi:MAG: hypothetical protein AB7Q01_14645 [Gammaproteobacteria bacterium]
MGTVTPIRRRDAAPTFPGAALCIMCGEAPGDPEHLGVFCDACAPVFWGEHRKNPRGLAYVEAQLRDCQMAGAYRTLRELTDASRATCAFCRRPRAARAVFNGCTKHAARAQERGEALSKLFGIDRLGRPPPPYIDAALRHVGDCTPVVDSFGGVSLYAACGEGDAVVLQRSVDHGITWNAVSTVVDREVIRTFAETAVTACHRVVCTEKDPDSGPIAVTLSRLLIQNRSA